jgi:hypothetical protein
MNQLKSNLSFFICLFSFITVSGQNPDSLSNIHKTDGQKLAAPQTKDNYLFVYDGLYDMNGSAQNLLSVSHLFGRGLDEISCKHDPITGFNYCGEKDGFISRVLIDGLNFFFAAWLSTVQHEGMGHGFRIREFNVKINRYDISPSMFGQPQVHFNKNDLPYYGKVLQDVGGSESNSIFAREAFRQGLVNDYFYHYYLYSFALKLDLPLYIIGSPKVGSYGWNTYTGGGWDVVEYIKDFEAKSTDNQQTIYNAAQKGALWSLADPSLLISLFNYTRDFIIHGKSQVKNPMIKIKNITFLPYTDFHLSPFGYEYYAGAYLKYNKTLFETYCRWSSGNIDGKSYGIGLNLVNLIRYNSFKFDAGIDIWKQGFNPLYYETNDEKYHKEVLSGKIYMSANYQIDHTFSLIGQLSYKGDGFLLGNPLEHSFNAKIGIGFYF